MALQSIAAWLADKASTSVAQSEIVWDTTTKVFDATLPKHREEARKEQDEILKKYLG